MAYIVSEDIKYHENGFKLYSGRLSILNHIYIYIYIYICIYIYYTYSFIKWVISFGANFRRTTCNDVQVSRL